MPTLNLKPTHKAIAGYYAGLEELAQLDLFGEGAVAPAFAAPLEWVENRDVPMSFRVEKMKLSRDKTSLHDNDFLTLDGIPAAVFDYKLGNRAALEWVIDRYRVTTDKRTGIINDPNAYSDDPQYIVKLIGKVVTVCVETVVIVEGLPGLE